MAKAESSSGGSTGIVAIVAIFVIVALGLFIFRGVSGRSGSGGNSPGLKGNVEIKVPSGGGQK